MLALRSYRGEAVLFTIKAVLPERADLTAGDLMVVSAADFRPLFALPAGVVNDIAVATMILPPSGALLASYRPASGDPDAVIRE